MEDPSNHTLSEGGMRPDEREAAGPSAFASQGHSERRKAGTMHKALFWAAGVDRDVIQQAQCFVDWGRCSALGAATLATAAVATITGGVVGYFFLFDQRLTLGIIGGLAWGALILTLDRTLLTSVIKQPDATKAELFRMAAPRWFLAVLIALAVGAPAELVVFRRQLDVQVAVDHQEEVGRQQQRLLQRFGDLPTLNARRSQLTGEIAGAAAQASAAFHDAQCEGEGTCGSDRAGAGPLHDEKLTRFRELQRRADQITVQNTPEVRDLTAQITRREHQREQDLASFEAMTRGSDDLLTRLLALEHLKSDPQRGGIVTAAEWIIRLLTLALEILPVTSKVFTRGAYDAAFLAEQDSACMHYDAERLCAEARAASKVDRERVLGRSAVNAASQLAEGAAEDAVNSPRGRQTRKAMAREILARAMPLGRKAAADVFADGTLEEDIKAAGRKARRETAERIVESERRKADALAELDEALAGARDLTKH